MDVASFMTPAPITIDSETSLEAALALMDDSSIRHLPVVDGQKLVGIVSDRDLLDATGWRLLGPRREDEAIRTTVRKWMQTDVISVGHDEPAVAPAIEVVLRGIGCLPVMDDGTLVGIVTEMDLLDLYARMCRESSVDGELDPPVEAIANRDAIVVAPDATVAQADMLCHAKGFRHLPVVDDGQLVGILSDRDLRRAAGANLSPDTTIDTLMTRHVVTIDGGERMSTAAERMVESRVSSLPVTIGDHIGIVTSVDILDRASGILRDSGAEAAGA